MPLFREIFNERYMLTCFSCESVTNESEGNMIVRDC